MTPVEYLLSVYPISGQSIAAAHVAKAEELQRILIEQSHAAALEQVGIISTSAKKIAAEYYRKNFTK